MNAIRSISRSGAFVTLSAGTLAAYEVNRLWVPDDEREPLADRYCGFLVDRLLEVFGTDLTVKGTTSFPTGALVVANHQSAMDIAVMLSVFRPVMVSRHDVADWPLLGRMARRGATIFVNREDQHSGAAAVRSIRRRVREGRTVVAFPEGGTFPEDTVHAFQPGAFAAVRPLEAPTIPVGMAYSPSVPYGRESFAQHLGKMAARRQTRIALHVGEPLDGSRDARETAEAARAEVQRLVLDARRELDG
ncbi:MAG: lysophospholipid acyltransferase family protein [Myxococcota bacterium]